MNEKIVPITIIAFFTIWIIFIAWYILSGNEARDDREHRICIEKRNLPITELPAYCVSGRGIR